MLNHVSLFSGYEGFGLGLKLAGMPLRTVLYCESEPYAQEILRARVRDNLLQDAPIWPDVRTLNGRILAGKVDVITAGFPCQPFSVAGLQRREDDVRNMWPDTIRVIREMGEGLEWILLENTPGLFHRTKGREPYFSTVGSDLSLAGFHLQFKVVSAHDVSAPHLRKRLWIVAHANNERCEEQCGASTV